MIVITAKFKINQKKEELFMQLISPLIEASKAETGCKGYDLHKNIKEPSTYCLIEKWENQATLDSHNHSSHFTDIVPKIVEISEANIEYYEPI